MRSLRSRILFLVSGALVVLTLLQSGVVFYSSLEEADEMFDHHLEQVALSLREGRFDPVTESLSRQPSHETEFEFAIRVRSRDGERNYGSGPHPVFPDPSPPGFSTIGAGADAWRLYTIATRDGTIQAAQAMAVRRDLSFELALGSVAPALIVLPFLLLFVGWAVRRAMRPLETVAHEVERRTENRLDPIDTERVLPEMLPVVRSVNDLLARIGTAFAAQRAFVADAAHELRSPLTALKLQAQLLPRLRDAESRAQAQAQLEAAVDRSVHLAEQLLALAREEGPPSGGVAQPGKVADAVKLALVDVATQAEARSVDIGLTASSDEAFAHVPLEAVRLLARNLLDNAIRHSQPGARVDATVTRVSDRVELTVDDAGPGIPEAERSRVFDRFFRGSAAAPGGSGLGLAIVQAIADRIRARVSLETSPLGGLRARVSFPAALEEATVG